MYFDYCLLIRVDLHCPNQSVNIKTVFACIKCLLSVNMYFCYVCGKHCAHSTTSFLAHLKQHRSAGCLKLPVLCRQGNCKSSFPTLFNFSRHLKSFHNDDGPEPVASNDLFDFSSVIPFELVDNAAQAQVSTIEQDFLQDIRSEGISLVAGLRANSSIPYCIISGVVESFNHMATSLTSMVKKEVISSMTNVAIDPLIANTISENLESRLETCSAPLDFLSTGFKQDSFFKKHPLAVIPETVNFSPRLESHCGSSRFVYDGFQYISVQKTLASLMQNEAYVNAILKSKCRPGVYTHFSDGSKCKEHWLFSDNSKLSLMIQLYYDGMGVTNPLRSHGSVHNVGVFYYTIKNLPEEFNTCFGNVHLLAMCYSHDLSVHGYEPVLDKFVSEIQVLSSTGIVGDFPILGHSTIYASLCQVTGDSLAVNGLLGFIESFSGSYFCTMCYATKADIQLHFSEDKFQRRTVIEYKKDLIDLPQEKKCGKVHRRGVKKDCVLNKIEGFHVTDNWCIDRMHVCLEGLIVVELGCILHGLCVLDKCITLTKVNEQLVLLWGKITVNKTHKPAEISKIQEPGHSIVPSMKAVQYWALLKYLPIAIGHLIADDNKHWHFLLHLSHLVDLVFAKSFTAEMAAYMRIVIADHLRDFKQLYGSDEVKLRPKHHFLVHIPTIILKSGPLSGMCCLRYELKNSFFKRSAHIVCNFKNICFTLAQRHQQFALFSHLSNNHIRDVLVVGKHSFISVGVLAFSDVVCENLSISSTDEVALATIAKVATVEYKEGNLLIDKINVDTGNPVFFRIAGFVSKSGDDAWYVVGENITTDSFCFHLHAYSVSFVKPSVFSLFKLTDLIDHHPLYCHSLFAGDKKHYFVRLPYHLF